MSFSELPVNESIERISLLLSRSLLMPQFDSSEPLPCLAAYIAALIDGDVASATRKYHLLAERLLNSNARRVSGDIFMDYLLHLVLVDETFYELCKHKKQPGRQDAFARAMRHEISILSELRAITSPLLYRLLRERARDTQKGGRDDIAMMTSAVWAGENVARPSAADKNAKKPPYTGRLALEAEFFSFRYGDVELSGSYAADEALEEMYFRLLETKDWSSLYESVCEMRLSYGAGDFMRYRRFLFCGDKLMPMSKMAQDGLPIPKVQPIPFYDAAREAIMENVISFMRGDDYDDMILLGGAACGKTQLMMSVPEELDELRLVLVDGDGYGHLRKLEYMLSQQPYRFLVVLDRLTFAEINEKLEVSMLLDRIGRGCTPRNVIYIATARMLPTCPCSFEPVWLPEITQADFVDIVLELRDNMADRDENYPVFTRDDVINACLDLRIDLGSENLNLFLANRVLRRCRRNITIR